MSNVTNKKTRAETRCQWFGVVFLPQSRGDTLGEFESSHP